MSLLVALVSVSALAIPALKDVVLPPQDEVDFKIRTIEIVYDREKPTDKPTVRASVLVTNTGERAGVLEYINVSIRLEAERSGLLNARLTFPKKEKTTARFMV